MPLAQSGNTPNIKFARVISRTTNQEPKANDALTSLAIFAQLHVISRTTTTAPSTPAEGDAYIVPAGATGYSTATASAAENDVAFYSNGWSWQTPEHGWRAYVEDEELKVKCSSALNWIEDYDVGDVQNSITAGTTQTQGQVPLTKVLSRVATCANANDVVTLAAARARRQCVVVNDGAQTLQVFPASGDAIDAGAVDASTTIAAGKRRIFMALDGTTWVSILGA